MCVPSMLILDRAIDTATVPGFGDQDMLPQVTAFMLESLRWRPVSLGGAFTSTWSFSF